MHSMFAGIDLSATPKRTTGLCFLEKGDIFSSHFEDKEIVDLVEERKPKIVAIDSPLSFYGYAFRDCDTEIRKRWRILPLTFPAMRRLAERGIRLKNMLSSYHVIEVYPYASKKSLGIKKEEDIKNYTIEFRNVHEFDAFVCALTAKHYFLGRYVAYGQKDKIIVPI